MARSGGPLDPPSGRWEAGLAQRRRQLPDGVPSGLFLFGSAVVILLVGVRSSRPITTREAFTFARNAAHPPTQRGAVVEVETLGLRSGDY